MEWRLIPVAKGDKKSYRNQYQKTPVDSRAYGEHLFLLSSCAVMVG